MQELRHGFHLLSILLVCISYSFQPVHNFIWDRFMALAALDQGDIFLCLLDHRIPVMSL
jgi:hypothetical protein